MIFTLNGMNDSRENTTHQMAVKLMSLGHEVTELRYSVMHVQDTRNRLRRHQTASILTEQIEAHRDEEKNYLVAHSLGCLLATNIAEHCSIRPLFDEAWFFAPAMDRQWIFPQDAWGKLNIIYNKNDRAVLLARFLPFWHPFGAMGRRGWQTLNPPGDPGNIRLIEDHVKMYPRSHSHYFKAASLNSYAQQISDRIEEDR